MLTIGKSIKGQANKILLQKEKKRTSWQLRDLTRNIADIVIINGKETLNSLNNSSQPIKNQSGNCSFAV